MNNPKLIKPSLKYEKSYREAFAEPGIGRGDIQLMMPEKGESFADFINRMRDEAKGVNLKKRKVPASVFWLIDDEEFIGRFSVRHKLNKTLRKYYGHIGYLVRPSKRRQGYGKKILELGLEKARKLGLTETLITCDLDNIPSRKIIEAHGGKFENQVPLKGKPDKLRYWIRL